MFSIDGSGKLGKKLIFREKKGTKDVKKYIVPKNPKTKEQETQRDYLKNAVLDWKTKGYTKLDIQAWNVYAKTIKEILSGYNIFIRLKINTLKEEKTFTIIKNCSIYDVTGGGFKVDIDVASDLTGILYLGTSKLNMIKEFEGTFSVSKYTFAVTGLLEKTKYYFYMKNTSVGEEGRTGIYYQKTGIEVALDIDIGCPAIDRPDYTSLDGAWTVVNKGNPANESGKITSVEVYLAVIAGGNGTFITFSRSGNRLTARDYEYVGDIALGYNKFNVNINVETGDVLGLYLTSYNYYEKTSAGAGVLYKSGDQKECVDKLFSEFVITEVSLYGIGKTII